MNSKIKIKFKLRHGLSAVAASTPTKGLMLVCLVRLVVDLRCALGDGWIASHFLGDVLGRSVALSSDHLVVGALWAIPLQLVAVLWTVSAARDLVGGLI